MTVSAEGSFHQGDGDPARIVIRFAHICAHNIDNNSVTVNEPPVSSTNWPRPVFATRSRNARLPESLFLARRKTVETRPFPVVPPDRYKAVSFGPKTAGKIVREAVLELTYTAHDMAPFARDMGYVNETGDVKPPFTWDGDRRLHLRAKLDAVFFHLYDVKDRDDIRYIYSTFPIVEREEKATYGGVYCSHELCLAYMNSLAAGNPDAEVQL